MLALPNTIGLTNKNLTAILTRPALRITYATPPKGEQKSITKFTKPNKKQK